MQREIPIIIHKNGDRSIPKFPVVLEGGDQLIIAKEMRGSQVPKGEQWTISGYSTSGPVISKKGASND